MKLKLTAALTLAVFLLCSCSFGDPFDGKAELEKARSNFYNASSAQILVYDDAAEGCNEQFEFRYNESGRMQFAYGDIDGNYSYSDGSTYKYNEGVNVIELSEGEEGCKFYTRNKKHPFLSQRLFFYKPSYIKSTVRDGNNITVEYNKKAFAAYKPLAGSIDGEIYGLTVQYTLNDGSISSICEQYIVKSGDEYNVKSETVVFSSLNGIMSVGNPFDRTVVSSSPYDVIQGGTSE